MTSKNVLRYVSTSASLYNFLGDTQFDSHMEIYKTAVDNALQAHDDLMNFAVDRLNIVDPDHILDNLATKKPLFVTFHTGSYNMLAALLLKQGHVINILSDTESVASEDYNTAPQLYRERYANNCWSEMVNVEEPGTIFQIIRRIKAGQPTIAFLDGNKGIGGQTKYNENMLDVSFLRGRVRVRKGLPFIAYLTQAPIVLVLNYQEGGERYIKFYPAITCHEKDRGAFCQQVIDAIFGHFSEHVRQYTGQWSNWLYVHNWTDLTYFETQHPQQPEAEATQDPSRLDFNAERYCPLKLNGRFYLFDRIRYSLGEVEEDRIALFSLKTAREERQQLIRNLYEHHRDETRDMVSRQILVEA